MISGKRILAVVPARGGSKGIPLKNLRPIQGVAMVARVADIVRALPIIDRAVVSTDHEDIARISQSAGLDAPFRRPPELSGDRIADWKVLLHALEETERIDGTYYDLIVMLQPTSPLRRPDHVLAAITTLIDGGWDSVWTVSETDSKAHPLKQLTITDESIDFYDPAGATVISRQELTPVYHRNGVAYVLTRNCLVEQKTIKGDRAGALVLNGPFVSIDTEEDIAMVEWLLARQQEDSSNS